MIVNLENVGNFPFPDACPGHEKVINTCRQSPHFNCGPFPQCLPLRIEHRLFGELLISFFDHETFAVFFFIFYFDRICGRATNCSEIRFDWLHRRKRNYSRAKRNFTRVPVWRGWKKVCTSWSKLLLGNANGLFLAISHFNNTNLRLRFILKLSCVTRKGTLMTIFSNWDFDDTWLVSL